MGLLFLAVEAVRDVEGVVSGASIVSVSASSGENADSDDLSFNVVLGLVVVSDGTGL